MMILYYGYITIMFILLAIPLIPPAISLLGVISFPIMWLLAKENISKEMISFNDIGWHDEIDMFMWGLICVIWPISLFIIIICGVCSLFQEHHVYDRLTEKRNQFYGIDKKG